MSIDTDRLWEIREEIEALREEALCIVDDARRQGDTLTYERAYRGWNAEIEMALSKSNQWLGQLTMDTLEETIEACETLNDEYVEEGAA
jgi:hypothetical protein